MMHLSSRSGLEFELNANGSIHRMRCAGTMLNLFLGSELEAGPANIYLRLRAQPLRIAPLLGPRAGTRFSADTGRGRLVGYGTWQDLRYRLTLTLSDTATAWFWHVWLQNDAGTRRKSI